MTRHAELLARYKHLRQVGLGLNTRLVETLTKSVLDEGGKRLGILKRNVLTLETEDEIAVLMDYCLHDVRRHGVNAVEQYLASSPPPPESDEWTLLQALRQTRFSLFAVEGAEPGVGVHVRDLLRDERLFLVDVGLSRTASVGTVLAMRTMAPEGIHMTTGAALPVVELTPAGVEATFPGAVVGSLTPEESSELATTIIRTCLRRGAAGRVEYREPEARPAARRVGRNDPCPCGSGVKFKRCCGGSAR